MWTIFSCKIYLLVIQNKEGSLGCLNGMIILIAQMKHDDALNAMKNKSQQVLTWSIFWHWALHGPLHWYSLHWPWITKQESSVKDPHKIQITTSWSNEHHWRIDDLWLFCPLTFCSRSALTASMPTNPNPRPQDLCWQCCLFCCLGEKKSRNQHE